jgi:uncharacterized protein YutE (UPF0331/DUF86 family)
VIAFDEDVVLAKVSSARKCVETVKELHDTAGLELPDWIRFDMTVLNLQRAIEACLDLANHLIAANSWELPRSGGHAFTVLADREVVPRAELDVLTGMVGFRNIAVHDYTTIDPAVVNAIVQEHLDDILRYVDRALDVTVRKQEGGPVDGGLQPDES